MAGDERGFPRQAREAELGAIHNHLAAARRNQLVTVGHRVALRLCVGFTAFDIADATEVTTLDHVLRTAEVGTERLSGTRLDGIRTTRHRRKSQNENHDEVLHTHCS